MTATEGADGAEKAFKPMPHTFRRMSFFEASRRVFDLSLGEMLWSRRTIFMGLVVGGPVLLALIVKGVEMFGMSALRVNGQRVAGFGIFGVMMWMLFLRFIIPVLGVFYGTALMADEVEDKTITYLFTRPIRRGAVLFGKYLAYLACTVLLILPSVVIVFFLMVPMGGSGVASAFPSMLGDLGMLAAGLAAYGAVFAWVGARVRRPLVAGLVFVLGWEPAVLLFPGYLKRLTVAYYLQALVPHAMPQDSAISVLMQAFSEVPGIVLSLSALLVLTLGALWAAARTVESREYVLEQ